MSEKPLRVLLVEDNPYDALLVRELIGETSILTDITTVIDGEQAVKVMEQAIKQAHVPDLVLLDLSLPKKDGHEVLAFIRSKEEIAQLCVVIYTSSRSPEDERHARSNNANAYLVKPMGAREMDETILKLRDILITVSKGSCPS
jgi:CheY-like chemotaxis protein